MIKKYSTPLDRFENLPDFPYAPHFLKNLSDDPHLNLHYLDENNQNQEGQPTFLCLHGEPTWCYLYRKMIPAFVKDGGRVIAPDFFGFGKSDKPLDKKTYSFSFHRNAILQLIEKLDLKNITLVCQDWGGLIGLTLPMNKPTRFKRLIVMNTMLATGDFEMTDGFKSWLDWSGSQEDMKIDRLMARSCPHLTAEEIAAYQAPFPTPDSKVAAHIFPQLVPQTPDDEGAILSQKARQWWKTEWQGQSFMAIGQQDPVCGPEMMSRLKNIIRHCPDPFIVKDAGHFVQEWGEIVAQKALQSFKA